MIEAELVQKCGVQIRHTDMVHDTLPLRSRCAAAPVSSRILISDVLRLMISSIDNRLIYPAVPLCQCSCWIKETPPGQPTDVEYPKTQS